MINLTSQKKISFYTKASLVPKGKNHATILFPFYGNYETNQVDTDFGRFDEYTREGDRLFSITDSPEACDFFLLPFEFSFEPEDVKESQSFALEAEKFNKKVIIFFNSDSFEQIPIYNSIVFRTSFYKSNQKKNEFSVPGWSRDFGFFKTKTKKSVLPTVSYCGYVDYLNFSDRFNWWRLFRKYTGRANVVNEYGPILRGKAVRKLVSDNRIDANFIIRQGFWAGGMDKKMARKQYVENMHSCDYALVARGAGNFSYRLYEVLSCGKIPIFINSDCVLPFDNIIDWKKYVIWIEENQVDQIAQKLLDFHAGISDEEMIEKKLLSRKLYDEWICPLAFFNNIHKCLKPI